MCDYRSRFREFSRKRLAGNSGKSAHFPAKSSQRGFTFSIRATFFERRQPLSCFSRSMVFVNVVIDLVVDESRALVLLSEPLYLS